MNIIVTGGAGFIGSNFIFHMLKKYPNYRIICLDCLTYAGNLSTLAPVMDNIEDSDIDMMVATLDEMFHMMAAMAQLKTVLEPVAKKSAIQPVKAKSDDEILANFIASLN